MTEAKSRNISVDILKLISMLMVIILHTKSHGLTDVTFESTQPMYWIVWTFQFLSLVAVNCFVLISGYYASASTRPCSPEKLFRLWLQVEICSVGIYLIMCAVPDSNVSFGFGQLLYQAVPVMSNQYWFFTCFLVLTVVSPFLNRFISSMEQKDFRNCILVILGLFVLIPSLNIYGDSFDSSGGYSLVWFVVLYLVAAYLRRYPLPKRPYGVLYVVISAVSALVYAFLDVLSRSLPLLDRVRDGLEDYNCITVFAASVCLFLFFVNHPVKVKKGTKRLITRMASVSFVIYLLHDHSRLREYLWENIVRLRETTDSIPDYLLRMLISVAVIFLAGIILGEILSPLVNVAVRLLRKIRKR